MRNTWKGMLLGALGGAAVGLALESIDRAARGAKQAVDATPDVASRAGVHAKHRAVTLVHEGAAFAARAARRAAERTAEHNGVHR
jgi:biotin carboxylase